MDLSTALISAEIYETHNFELTNPWWILYNGATEHPFYMYAI